MIVAGALAIGLAVPVVPWHVVACRDTAGENFLHENKTSLFLLIPRNHALKPVRLYIMIAEIGAPLAYSAT